MSKSTVTFSGVIGRSWAILFASAGYEVKLHDAEQQVVAGAIDDILVQLKKLAGAGMSRGRLSVAQQHQRISAAKDLADCVSDAIYVQVYDCTVPD